jgi:hypothetical protein
MVHLDLTRDDFQPTQVERKPMIWIKTVGLLLTYFQKIQPMPALQESHFFH